MTSVPVIPGDYRPRARTVTKTAQSLRIPRANTRQRSRTVGIDRLTVLALLGFCLIADGGALFLCGWLFGGS